MEMADILTHPTEPNGNCVLTPKATEHNYQPLGDSYHQFEQTPVNKDHLKFRTLFCTKCGQTIRVVQENEKA